MPAAEWLPVALGLQGASVLARAGVASHLGAFLAVSFVVALASSAIRTSVGVSRVAAETLSFFLTIVVCIGLFGGLVLLLEWLFVRPIL